MSGNREPDSGRYAHRDDRTCSCGHPHGEHTPRYRQPDGTTAQACLAETADGAPCNCPRFRAQAPCTSVQSSAEGLRLGPIGRELVRSLCCYVLQHGNVHRSARTAAEVLAGLSGGVPPEERQNAVALVRLAAALDAVDRVSRRDDPEKGPTSA